MEPNVNFVDYISTLLDSGKYKEALSILNEQKYLDSLKDNCWDLISVVLGKIQDDTIIVKPSLYGACEELLAVIIQKVSAEEALLEFIEQIEIAKNDAQFGLLLGPLQKLLKKLYMKRGRSLEWCLNSISTYIESIPIPEHLLEGKECLLLDSDVNIRRITRIYTLLVPFYKPFINELCDENMCNKSKQIIAAFLISLLGKPLIYIDMDPDSNAKSETRQCCNTIINDICALERNVWKLLQFINICNRENLKSKPIVDEDSELAPYDHREKINMTTLSCLAYTIFSGHFTIPDTAIPQVYSFEYTVNTLLLSVIHLLSFTEYGPLTKAVSLCSSVLYHMPANASHIILTTSVHFDLCKGLANVAIYSVYESVRKRAVYLIECHINKFGYKAIRKGHKYILPLATVPVSSSQKVIRNYCQNKNSDAKSPTTITVTEHDEQQYEENVKNRILQRSLEFVPKSGWSVESLGFGAEAAGYPGISHGLFPNGGGDLVHYFNIKSNETLVQEMKNWPKEDLKENKVPTKFIENAIITRLLMIEPYKNTWPKAMAIQALPNNVPHCLATLLSLVDDICYHSGDRSVDFNWYIRRVGLAGIYKAAELFYLTDKSEEYNATRNFVASRIRDAQLIQTALNLNPVSAAPQTLTAAFVTAKNILGINTLK